MFSRIQTRYFRSLKAVDQVLAPMQALVGPNASGKTTFLDVIDQQKRVYRVHFVNYLAVARQAGKLCRSRCV